MGFGEGRHKACIWRILHQYYSRTWTQETEGREGKGQRALTEEGGRGWDGDTL